MDAFGCGRHPVAALTQCDEVIPPVPPVHAQSNWGGWLLGAIVVLVIVYEVWAYKTGRPTISQWVKRKTRGRRWWKAFGMGVIGLTLWHLFFGGPI